MESSRLKNIIILILALLNLCLLSTLAMRQNARQSAQRQAREELVALFAADQVELDEALIPREAPPPALTLTQSPQENLDLAAALLGGHLSVSDQGGGIYQYSSPNGAVLFRTNGSFDAYTSLDTGEAEDFCRDFCRRFGYEGLALSLDDDGSGAATATQLYNGYPVADCTVTFTIQNGAVRTVTGTCLPRTAAETGGEEPLSAISALTAFFGARRSTGAAVTTITDVSLCYQLQGTVAAPIALAPAWCVSTDMADFYVNCITGVVTAQ